MYLALPPQCIVIIYSQISKRTMSPGKHSHCGYAIKTSFVITHRTTNFKRRRRISSEVQLPRLSTLKSTTYPAFVILQKIAMRVMTFSKFHEHYSPIFKHLHIVKRPDIVFLNIAVFMYKIHNRRLLSVFDALFTQVNKRHNYNTRGMFYT